MLHEVDEDRLGPLEIVDHDDLGAFSRACLEEPPERELRLRRRRADDRVGRDAERDQDLDQRPVRDALPVRKAPPTKDVGCVAHALEEVSDEARLPDAGRPEQREESTGGVRNRILVVAPETLALPVSPHERRLEPPRERVCVVQHPEEPKGLDQLGLPFQREWLNRLDLHRVAHKQPGLGPDQRLGRGCRLLEARSHVDRIARHERLTLATDDDLTRVDPHPRLEAVRRDRDTHLRCCTHRPEGVVLVRHRDPENRHHRIADELLDGATVTLDDRAEILEIAAHPPAQSFGIGRLAQRRRTHEIAEEDGDDLALLACRCRRCQRHATERTERELTRKLFPTCWARRHARSLWSTTYSNEARIPAGRVLREAHEVGREPCSRRAPEHRFGPPPTRRIGARPRTSARVAATDDLARPDVSPCRARPGHRFAPSYEGA